MPASLPRAKRQEPHPEPRAEENIPQIVEAEKTCGPTRAFQQTRQAAKVAASGMQLASAGVSGRDWDAAVFTALASGSRIQ